jgi:hypothetical protein
MIILYKSWLFEHKTFVQQMNVHTSIDDPCGFSNLRAHVGLEPLPQVGMHLDKHSKSES